MLIIAGVLIQDIIIFIQSGVLIKKNIYTEYFKFAQISLDSSLDDYKSSIYCIYLPNPSMIWFKINFQVQSNKFVFNFFFHKLFVWPQLKNSAYPTIYS